MQGFLERFKNKADEEDPVNRKFYSRIITQNVLDQDFESCRIEPEKHYFQIRLAEMFLKNKKEYLRGFIPLSVVVSRFKYNKEFTEFPFLVGNQMLKSVGFYVKDEQVEYRNIRVAGPAPYTGGDVNLFIGLFRIQVSDLAEKIFGLMENVISVFDTSRLTGYLNISKMVSSGLANLMGQKEVEMRLGTMDEFSGQENAENKFESGYLVFINCPDTALEKEQLWVEDGVLMTGTDEKNLTRFARYDYCLVRLEALTERQDLDTLDFHLLWEKAQKNIWEGNNVSAKTNYLALMSEIATTSDLTQDHRQILLQVYMANYHREKELYAKIFQGSDEAVAKTRSGRGKGSTTARGAIAKMASQVKKAVPKPVEALPVESTLKKISSSWKDIPHLSSRGKETLLTGSMLNDQIRALQAVQSETAAAPEILAKAITSAAFET